MDEQATTEEEKSATGPARRGPGRPVSRVRREEKENAQEYRTVLVEPYMHRDLKRVAALAGRPMRELLEEAFYLHPQVITLLEQLKQVP